MRKKGSKTTLNLAFLCEGGKEGCVGLLEAPQPNGGGCCFAPGARV